MYKIAKNLISWGCCEIRGLWGVSIGGFAPLCHSLMPMITQMKNVSDSKTNLLVKIQIISLFSFLVTPVSFYVMQRGYGDFVILWKVNKTHISIELEKNCTWHSSSDGSVRYWKIFHFLVLLLCHVRLTDACSHGGFTKALLVSVWGKANLSLPHYFEFGFGFCPSPWFYTINLSLPESFN